MLFVRELRPLSRHSFSSHLFHLAQRKDYMMVVTRLWAFCLVFGLCLWFLLFSPPSGCFAHTASVLVEKKSKMADRPYNQYGPHLYSKERWDQLCAWLTGNPNFRFQLADHKQALRDHMGCSQEASDPSNKARTVPPPGAGSSSSAAGSSWHCKPPPSPSPYGWSYGWWQ